MSLFSSNLRAETKAKFDSLLKSALRRNPAAKSREKLVSDEETKAETNDCFEMESFEDHEDKKYIMDKFLKDANQDRSFKAPVPRPRKKVSQSSRSSSCTYLVSPKKTNCVEMNGDGDKVIKISSEVDEEIKENDSEEDNSSGKFVNAFQAKNVKRQVDILSNDDIEEESDEVGIVKNSRTVNGNDRQVNGKHSRKVAGNFEDEIVECVDGFKSDEVEIVKDSRRKKGNDRQVNGKHRRKVVGNVEDNEIEEESLDGFKSDEVEIVKDSRTKKGNDRQVNGKHSRKVAGNFEDEIEECVDGFNSDKVEIVKDSRTKKGNDRQVNGKHRGKVVGNFEDEIEERVDGFNSDEEEMVKASRRKKGNEVSENDRRKVGGNFKEIEDKPVEAQVEIVNDSGRKKKNTVEVKETSRNAVIDSVSDIVVVKSPKKIIPKPRRRKQESNLEYSSVSTGLQSDEADESSKVLKIGQDEVSYEPEIKTKPEKPQRIKLEESSTKNRKVEETSSGVKMSNEDLDQISYEQEIKPKPRTFKRTDNLERISTENAYNYEKIFNVAVHRTDKLQLDSYVIHPVVKIHMVDVQTGEYLKKSDKARRVLFYYESNEIDYVGPIMTHPFNLQENRSLYPNWEENILINEDVEYLKNHENLIIFFEILDFLSVGLINSSSNKDSRGWHKIAWAFVKPAPTNLNKRLRLQLHRPHKSKASDVCEVFSWWSRRKFNKYPSTLHVSLMETLAPKPSSGLRSKTPHQKESGKKIIEEKVAKPEEIVWKKSHRQVYKLPNKCVEKFDGGDDGCFLLKFSNSGNELAVCVLLDGINTVVIYSTINYEEIGRLPSHQGLIHNLIWSENDAVLITASSDCTVSIWNTTNYTFKQMLPHPSYVYSCDIRADLIATGCYDKYIRIWSVENEAKYKLRDELKSHKGYVTTLSFNKDGRLIFSGDSLGVIIIWSFVGKSWNVEREIKILDIKGIVINQMIVYKREKRVLVSSRDDKIRSVDVKSGFVLQTYSGALNSRVSIKCALSPCGNFVFSGSESGDLFVWNTDSGKVEKIWKPYEKDLTIHCVTCHPKDSCVALGHYGNSVPVLLYKHDEVEEIEDALVPDRISSKRHRERNLDFKGILQKMDNIIGVKE